MFLADSTAFGISRDSGSAMISSSGCFNFGRTEDLERLAVEMYTCGLSVRDIGQAFTEERGGCLPSKMATSDVTERLWTDCQAFANRDLL